MGLFEYVITRPLGWIINMIYHLVNNYGTAIILFTILIKLVLLPLNIKSQKAMKKQQKIQPIMAELQKKYANDKDKLQREMMKIYKENDISMTGGCLPMLIQMPILIGLYQAIRFPLNYLIGVDWSLTENIQKVYQIRDAMAVQFPQKIGSLAGSTMEQIINTAQLQLSKWAELINGSGDPWFINFDFLKLDLAGVPSAAITKLMSGDFSEPGTIMLLIIPVLAIAATFLSSKITQNQTQAKDANGKVIEGNEQAAQMSKSMNLMMPIMTGFFTFTLPAGMGVYWIISSVMQILQQVILNYYFDKKGDEFDVKIPEQNRKKGKKRR